MATDDLIQEIKDSITLGTFSEKLELLKQQNKIEADLVEKNNKEYSGDHKILKRPDKTIGTKDATKKTVKTAKLIANYQKKIVRSTVAFLFGEPVSLVVSDEQQGTDGYKAIMDIWRENKLDYFNKKICRKTSVDTRAAELWYTAEGEKNEVKIKVMLLAESNGDGLFPYYDQHGDLILFTI